MIILHSFFKSSYIFIFIYCQPPDYRKFKFCSSSDFSLKLNWNSTGDFYRVSVDMIPRYLCLSPGISFIKRKNPGKMVWPTELACRPHTDWVAGLNKVPCLQHLVDTECRVIAVSMFVIWDIQDIGTGSTIPQWVRELILLSWETQRGSHPMKRGGIEVGQLQEGQTLTSLISPRVHILKHDQHATYSGVVCVPFQGKEDFLSLGTSCYTSITITLPEHVYHKQHILYKYSSLHTQFLLFKVCVISPSLIIFFLCCCSWSLRSLQCKTL